MLIPSRKNLNRKIITEIINKLGKKKFLVSRINLSFVFFIPSDLATSVTIFEKMFFLNNSIYKDFIDIDLVHILLVLLSFIVVLFFINSNEFFIKKNIFNNYFFLILLIFLSIFFFTEAKFVYFDF